MNNAGLIKAAGQNINVGVSTANFNTGSVVDAASNIAYLYSGQNNYSGNLTLTGDVRTYTGVHTYADSTVVGGTGTLSQTSGSAVMNNVAMNKAYFVNAGNTLTLNSGKTLTVNGGIGIDARSNVDTGVVGGGTLSIPVGATATITGGNNNDVYFDNVTLNNAGIFDLSQPNGGHVTVLNNGAVFNNLAAGEVRFSGLDNQLITTAGAGTLNNAGLIKANGQNINVGVTVANYNSGSVVDAAGNTAYLYSTQNNYNGAALTGNQSVIAGGTHTATGLLTANKLNVSAGSLGGAGTIVVTTDFTHTGGTFNPSGSVDLTRTLGTFNIGPLSTNGTIKLSTGGGFDINLNGNLTANNSGLADNVAAISVNAGGNINLASTTNLTANTSGAIVLNAAGFIDLKVNDFGGNGSANALTAVGNIGLTAGGTIGHSDGNNVSLSGAALNLAAVGNISALGGAMVANSGNALVNSSGGSVALTSLSATAGVITVGAATTLDTGTLNANAGLNLSGGSTLTFGPLSTSTGTIVLNATGATSDLILNGDVNIATTGLAAGQAAFSATAGRDVLLASTTDITTASGAVALQAARNVDLKLNDFGGNGSANSINAAGNLDITATTGQVYRSDGNTVSASAANLNLTAGTNIGAFGGAITATSGNVSLNAPGSVDFTSINAAGATGNINITSSAATVTGGTLSAGQNVTLNLNSSGGVTLGTVTAGTGGNGVISLQNIGVGAVNLNGNLMATHNGLADNQAAINVTTNGNINLASTTNLVANTSGGISLVAGGNMDLKVNDFGGNGSANTLSAVGNINLQSGGSISRSDGNNVSFSSAALNLAAVGNISALGGSIVANTGNAVVNSSAGSVALTSLSATAGVITVGAATTLDTGTLNANAGLNLSGGSTLTFGPLSTSTGTIVLNATGATSDLILNGDVNIATTGLAAGQAAFSATAGRDVLLASTTDITTASGAVALQAARNVDLKLNDFGGNGSANSINAAGNLDITATTGQVYRSDGNTVSASAANLNLTAGTNIGAFGGAITATSGNVSLNAPGSVDFTSINAAGATGNINITSSAATVTGGTLSAGQNVTLNLNSSGGVTLGTVTAGTGGNGVISLQNIGVGAVNLNGNLMATHNGLADNQAAINVTTNGNINLASTTNLVASTSGSIVMNAAGSIDLKVNDFGGNGSANALTAVGNINLLSGGSIFRSDGNTVGLSGAALDVTAASNISALGGTMVANTGNAVVNSSAGSVSLTSLSATAGAITVGAATSLNAGTLNAGSGMGLASGDTMTLGTLANAAGSIVLNASGPNSDIVLNGTVNNSASGFSATQAAFSATAGRDLLVASTTNISTASGAVGLQAARNVDLKMNDFGGNGSANAINAAGNLDITASAGQIIKSDGNGISATGQAIALTYATSLDNTVNYVASQALNITKTSGDVTPNIFSGPALNFTALNGNVVFAPGSSFSGGPVTVGGSGSAIFAAGSQGFTGGFVANMPVLVSGGIVNLNGPTPQIINTPWQVTGGTLNLRTNGTNITAVGSLNVASGQANLAPGSTLTNEGTLTANNNLLLQGDFINQAGATANLTNVTIGGSGYNSGTFNVGGLVTIAGPIAQQLGGVINIPASANLDMSNPTGLFSWNDGTIAGTGAVGFSGGGSFNFAGNGQRVIDGLNFSFNNLTLPNGSLTLKSGSLTLSGATVLPTGVALNLEGGLLTNNGSLDVAGTFGLTGGAFAGPGTLNMTGGSMNLPAGNNVTWTNSGLLTNTGTLNLAGSSITNAIDNQGTINLGNGLSFVNPVTNTGTLVAQAGTMTLFSSGLTQQAGGLLQLNNGELSGNINLANGSISGSGTINGNLVVGSATLAPGFSPGAITITGNLTMDANSVLNIELGGPGRGTGYDWINVLGTAQLAGTLNVTSYNGFTPPAGSSYNVMQFASKTGNFATLNLPVARSLVVSNLPTSIMLAMPELVAPAPAPTPVPAAPQAPAPAAVAQVIVAETRLEEVQELVADLKVEPPRKSDKEPEVEACP